MGGQGVELEQIPVGCGWGYRCLGLSAGCAASGLCAYPIGYCIPATAFKDKGRLARARAALRQRISPFK